ncbi:hypothetical protein [Streptomyces sp. NPDC001260]|uniref:hypothetical protein n=1 Tax=Streptomyces sp. NPDC001260 TaxID=3364551 RepID=UPI0036AEE350
MTERRQPQRHSVGPAWPRTTAVPGPVASERRTRVTVWTAPGTQSACSSPAPDGSVHAGPAADAADHAPRLAAALSPEARPTLMTAPAGTDARHEAADRTAGREAGDAFGHDIGPVLAHGTGQGGDRPVPHSESPAALVRLGFTDAEALARAGAAFAEAGRHAGFGDACSDPATLTLRIQADAGLETLRTVLAVLDAAAVTAESLTVHTRELDDVFAAFTSLP